MSLMFCDDCGTYDTCRALCLLCWKKAKAIKETNKELAVALEETLKMYRLLAGPDDEISQAVIAQAEAALKKGRDDVEIVAT